MFIMLDSDMILLLRTFHKIVRETAYILKSRNITLSNATRGRDKAVLLLWIINVISVFVLLCFRVRLFIDAL